MTFRRRLWSSGSVKALDTWTRISQQLQPAGHLMAFIHVLLIPTNTILDKNLRCLAACSRGCILSGIWTIGSHSAGAAFQLLSRNTLTIALVQQHRPSSTYRWGSNANCSPIQTKTTETGLLIQGTEDKATVWRCRRDRMNTYCWFAQIYLAI